MKKIETWMNTDPAAFCNKSQTHEKGAGERERGLFKCQPPERKRVLLSQSPSSDLSAGKGFIRSKRERAEQRRRGGGAVEVQAVFLLLPLCSSCPRPRQDGWFLQRAQKRVLAMYNN